MNKIQFFKDLEKVYKLVEKRQAYINSFYEILKEDEQEKSKIIEQMLKSISMPINNETKLAVITRLVSLRSDSIKQLMEKENFDENRIEKNLEKLYGLVSEFYIKSHYELIQSIKSENLLTPFYQAVFEGVHLVGVSFTKWQSKWTNHIIYGINKELFELFNGDEEKIYDMFVEKNLHDIGHNNEIADRSYSALVKNSLGEYESKPYCDIFEKEVFDVVSNLEHFINNLSKLEDEIFGQKEFYIKYLLSIKEALLENNRHNLVKKWAEVDRKWMKVTAPLQIGHPLEYYEDHYRKAVALEWDLRIVNPNNNAGKVIDDVKRMYKKYFQEVQNVSHETTKIYNTSLKSLNRVQLYLGRPALFYGAEFDGLFSAQVVPNDEVVSKEEGKKIFAFADNVYEAAKAKPFLKLHSEIFPEDFLHESRVFLFQKEKEWHEVYNITTIGHEYGHILWIDDDTESIMNKSGAFKNIEEFKATTGGLVAFFENENKELKKYVLEDIIKRAVGLISWMETPEVLAYYCEGLIHLKGLFESGVLRFDKKLVIDESKYDDLKEWYKKTYTNLATHYVQKKDAKEFLEKFARKKEKTYEPIDEEIRYFVNYYWNLYKEIGQVVDDKISKDDYIK